MAFTWTSPSKQGAIVSTNGIQELQDNCDSIDNAIACINEKSVDLTSQYIGDDSAYWVANLGGNFGSYFNNVESYNEAARYVLYRGSDVSDNAVNNGAECSHNSFG